MAPDLALIREDARQREHPLREVTDALRWLLRTGGQWRMMPDDLAPWAAVHQQAQRWMRVGVFEQIVHDLRELVRLGNGRSGRPSALILDSSTLQGTPETGPRAGYDGYERRKGSKIHAAVDTLGQLLVLYVTPANEQDRQQVPVLAEAVQ